MNQTPAHQNHNPELLDLIPTQSKSVIEIGCSSGALAREYRKINTNCHYVGIDIDPEYAKMAEPYCNETFAADIELLPDSFFKEKNCDTWIFGDTLEHLKDPWVILKKFEKIFHQMDASWRAFQTRSTGQ